jgi:hypothetical protein
MVTLFLGAAGVYGAQKPSDRHAGAAICLVALSSRRFMQWLHLLLEFTFYANLLAAWLSPLPQHATYNAQFWLRPATVPGHLHAAVRRGQRCAVGAGAAAHAALLYIENPTLGVACFGNDYSTMCVVDDLSRRARRLLREVKYESKQLATVEAIMISERRLDNEIEEKEPTAYLLRRFYATTLYILGFSDAEQEYLMGHGISDDGVDRRDYTNEDLRIELWQKMEQHPLCEMVRRYGIEVFHEPTKCAQIQQDLQAMQSLFQKIRNPNKRRINLLYQDYMMALLELHNNKKRRVRTKYK